MTAAAASGGRPRVLYVQYTNPAAYPPLLHSIGLLAEAGAVIQVLGLDTLNDSLAQAYPAGVRLTLRSTEHPGWKQKVHYLRFAAEAARLVARFHPDWVYASDTLSTPVARYLLIGRRPRLVYHEHDAPMESWRADRSSWFMRRVLNARTAAARRADICVVPNIRRAHAMGALTGREDVTVVWNCPRRSEAVTARGARTGTGLRVVYHGSIVPARVPLAVIDALALVPSDVVLVIAGYETLAYPDYVRVLLERAAARGVADRVTYAGVLTRPRLLDLCATCDVGLALFAEYSPDPNEAAMVGASNKAFEYLARGLALVVGRGVDWREVYEAAGMAVSCDPDSAESIAAALGRLRDDPAACRAMGERGRQRVLSEWNYERSFAPVLEAITARS